MLERFHRVNQQAALAGRVLYTALQVAADPRTRDQASINLAKVGFPIRAIVCVKAPRDQYPRLISRARDIPEVRAAHHANEPTSFVLRVVARDEADLKRVLDSFSEFGPIDCVRILSTPVEKHSA